MNAMLAPILLPLFLGCMLVLLPARWRQFRFWLRLAGALAFAAATWYAGRDLSVNWQYSDILLLQLDTLSRILLWTAGGMASLIVWMTSYGSALDEKQGGKLFMALSMGALVLMANHFLLLLIGWGALGILLYMLIPSNTEDAARAAKKTLFIIGGTDALLIFGVVVLVIKAGTPLLSDFTFQLNDTWSWIAFVSILCAVFSKIAAMPFHTWLPSMAAESSGWVNAMLPSTLDKLIGIYFLARLIKFIDHVPPVLRLILMALGLLSLFAGVMMALVQHDMRKLLAYHAVSQAGYMILGLATCSVIGVAGAIFHLINNVIYKSGLFLTAGIVRDTVGHTHLAKIGGLARKLPFVFPAFLILALAISGIPPLNGFFSKWLIAQSLIDCIRQNIVLAPFALVVALVGSGLTLASFLKLTYAVFMGPSDPDLHINQKVAKHPFICVPIWILAILCIVLGLFANRILLPQLMPGGSSDLSLWGFWSPLTTGGLFLGGILIALFTLFLVKGYNRTEVKSFSGGEIVKPRERVLATEFYRDVENLPVIKWFYNKAYKRIFDIYEQGIRLGQQISKPLRELHNGLLNRYVSWLFVGWIILLAILIGVSRG
ncbi:hypothetical protein KAR48_16750 [bacterium]|nr:hypothetical protein [bacterium]